MGICITYLVKLFRRLEIDTLTQNKNFTRFIMGFTIPEIKTPVPPNAGNKIQSFVGMLNFISLGVSF